MAPTETDEQRPASALNELASDPSSRKRFLKAAGGTGAAGALGILLAACGEKKVKPTAGGSDPNTGAGVGTDRYGKGDLGIARYAVTLEYVEVDFYEKALASGKLKGQAAELARRFGEQERQHVRALEGAIRKLGGEPPAKPRANFPLQSQKAIVTFAADIEGLG